MAKIEVIRVVQNDELYEIQFTLKEYDGTALDLTDVSSIKLKVAAVGGTALELTGTCTKQSPYTNGICTYEVQNGELATVGRYHAEIELTYSGGKIWTSERFDILVEKDLP